MTVLVSDSFNRINTPSSIGSTDSYAGGTSKTWTVYQSSTWGISSNQAYIEYAPDPNAGGANPVYALIDSGVSNCSISVTASVPNGFICMFRVDPTTRTGLLFDSGGVLSSFVGSANGWSTLTNIASSGVSIASGDVIKVTLNGSAITVYRNGTQILTATSTINQTVTKHGIGNWTKNTARWDNFIVEDLNTGGTPTTQDGSASVIGTGTLSATATKLQNALASMVGTGTLIASPVLIKNGQTSLVGQGLLVANADTLSSVVIVDGSTDVKGSGLLTASSIALKNGAATLQGQGIVTANADTIHIPTTIDGVFSALGTGFLTADGEVIEFIEPEVPAITIDAILELLFDVENKIVLSSEVQTKVQIHSELENKVLLTF